MEELFSNKLDPRKTKGVQINNIRSEIEKRKTLDKELLGLNQQKINKCNVCGCPEQTNIDFETNGYSWIKCPECTHVYKNMMPDNDAMTNYFKKATTHVYLDESSFDFRVKNIAQPKYDFMMRYVKNKIGRWLDLATGVADLPYLLKLNKWDFDATELYRAFLDFAEKKTGIRPKQITLLQYYDMFLDNKMELFDVIGAFGYYDLLSDPLEHCKIINRMLKPGGFHGINIPNSNSLSGALVEYLPHSSLRMSTPITISSFTYKSMVKMLGLAGFEVEGILWHGLDIHELLMRIIELDHNFKDSKAYNLLYENINELQHVIDKAKKSDLLLICAKKVREV